MLRWPRKATARGARLKCRLRFMVAAQGTRSKRILLHKKVASIVCWPRRATVRSAFEMWLWIYVGHAGQKFDVHL